MAPMARTIVVNFAAMTKDIPMEMSRITTFERDRSNYCHWELYFMLYIEFILDVAEFVTGEKEEDSGANYKQDFAAVVNHIIH